jgi:5'-methylthioadenosine phosphorylase
MNLKAGIMQADYIPKTDYVIIGGVGAPLPVKKTMQLVSTPFGKVEVFFVVMKKRKLAIIPRHSVNGKHLPPHMINYRANIKAAEQIGARRIISINSVGSMKNHPPGSFFVPDDFIDFTKMRPSTFFDDETVHINVSEPYCPQLRTMILESLSDKKLPFSEGTYVCTEGPRFETKAEIRMLSQFGDVVGMTGIPEAVLAKELQLCYASLCTIANPACGFNEGKLTTDDILNTVESTTGSIFEIILDSIGKLGHHRSCNCKYTRQNVCL